jgi:hypothetical protein
VRSARLELAQPYSHKPLKLACLPIPPRPRKCFKINLDAVKTV